MRADRVCLGCMEPSDGAEVCPRCGWRRDTPAQSPLYLPPGAVLQEQYLLGRVLGHGGFGITYLAWDLNLARKLAVKEYLPQGVAVRSTGAPVVVPFSGSVKQDFEYGLEKFLDEARVLARFADFPGIASVLNFFRANGTAYLVMEYLDGVTFEEFLARQGGKVSFETARRVMMPVMDALREVHRAEILHRDISPDNVLVTRSGQVKLLDFGAARYALSQQSRNLSVILKEGYAPEEQYRTKGKQGPWTDVYAVGATLYRAITGTTPPPALDRLDADELQPPRSVGAEISAEDEVFLLRALAVKAGDRFASIEDLQAALAGTPLPAGLAATAPAPGPAPYTGEALAPPRVTGPARPVPPAPSPGSPSRVPRWVWGGAGALVAVGGALFAFWPSDAPTRSGSGQPSPGIAEPRAPTPPPIRQSPASVPAIVLPSGTPSAGAGPGVTQPPLGRPSSSPPPGPVSSGGQSPVAAIPPAGAGYAELVDRAAVSLRRRDLREAETLLDRAIQADPAQPRAYELQAQLRLYSTSDVASAADSVRKSLARGGGATFRVNHDRSGGRLTAVSEGSLTISRSGVTFDADDGSQRFTVRRGEIREFKRYAGEGIPVLDDVVRELQRGVQKLPGELGRVFGGGAPAGKGDGPPGAFVITAAQGETHVFAATSPRRDEERTLILSVAGELGLVRQGGGGGSGPGAQRNFQTEGKR